MTMNYATGNLKMGVKTDVSMSYEDNPMTPSSPISTTSSILGLAGRISSHTFLNGAGSGITCRVCGKHEYVTNGEFETIKLGDLFPNMSSSALSSPVAATTVAVGLCNNCTRTQRSSINPIFQQAASVIKSENRSSLLLQHQQSLMPSMFRGWNSSSSNNDRTILSEPPPLTTTAATNIQYSPKGKPTFPARSPPILQEVNQVSLVESTPTSCISTTATSLGTGLPVSVLLGNNYGQTTTTITQNNSQKKSPLKSSPEKTGPPAALNLNLLASASVLSSEGLVMGKKSAPSSVAVTGSSPVTPSTSKVTAKKTKKKSPKSTSDTLPMTSTPTADIVKTRTPGKDCSVCNRTFKSAKIAEQHFRRVHNGSVTASYCCDICGALFSYRSSLDSHLASHNPPLVTHDCPTCGQKFKEKSNLNTHLKLHSDTPKKFKCEFCPSGFSKKVNLRTHIKRKHPEQGMNVDPNNSQMQPGQFNNNGMGLGGLGHPSTSIQQPPQKKDNQSDKPEGNFKCEHCGRAFLFKNNLKAHLRTHTRDRKYTCEICEKSFIYKESLKNHMLLHSNEVPYQCDICLKKFRDRSNRRKHVKNVHKYMFVNGDSSSLAPISGTGDPGSGTLTSVGLPSTSSSALPTPKKTRRRNNKRVDPNDPTVKSPKRNKKSNKESDNPGNNSVIVSNASCMDPDRKIIMSPGPKMTQQQQQSQSIEYNLHSQNLPVTVHVPSPSNSMYGRNVIVKATGPSTSTSVPLPQFSDPYHRDPGPNPAVPMQQNVIVYPKPKQSLQDNYGSDQITESSVISSHLTQYYNNTGGSGQAGNCLPIGIAYPEPSASSYNLMDPSSRSTTPNPANNSFESYVIGTGRRNSSSSNTSKSPPGMTAQGVLSHPQYSVSPAPVFSTQAGPLRNESYFWSPADNVNVSHGSPYYGSPQNNPTPTSTGGMDMDNSANLMNAPPYVSQGHEIVGGMEIPSVSVGTVIPATTTTNPSSFYYKDFDFSYL